MSLLVLDEIKEEVYCPFFNGQEKSTVQSFKQKISANPKMIIDYFETLLRPYMKHCANIDTQSNYTKTLKSNLKSGECIVHCDQSWEQRRQYIARIVDVNIKKKRVRMANAITTCSLVD